MGTKYLQASARKWGNRCVDCNSDIIDGYISQYGRRSVHGCIGGGLNRAGGEARARHVTPDGESLLRAHQKKLRRASRRREELSSLRPSVVSVFFFFPLCVPRSRSLSPALQRICRLNVTGLSAVCRRPNPQPCLPLLLSSEDCKSCPVPSILQRRFVCSRSWRASASHCSAAAGTSQNSRGPKGTDRSSPEVTSRVVQRPHTRSSTDLVSS